MLLLTLNMNMFNFVIDDSFNDYFDSISTDIAFIQECRYNRINEQYYAKWAGNYEEPIDRRFHLSVAISKDENISKSNNDLKADYTCIFVKYALKGTCIKTDSLNEGKSLSKNGSPVTFLIEKSDYDYSLLFFINRIKGKVIIDYHKTNAPACQYRIIYQTKLLWQVG